MKLFLILLGIKCTVIKGGGVMGWGLNKTEIIINKLTKNLQIIPIF